MSALIYLILAICSSAALSLVLRLFSGSQNNRYGLLLGNYLTCTLLAFLFTADKSLLTHSHPVTYLCGLFGGILFVLSLVCMQGSIHTNGAILTSAFSKLGLLVPLCFSLVLFHETPSVIQLIGLIFVILAVLIMNTRRKDAIQDSDVKPLVLAAVLLTNGMSDSMAKIFDVIGIRSEDSVYFFMIFLSASVLTALLLLSEGKKTGKKTSIKDMAAGIAAGIPNYFSSVLLLKALNTLPAFITYPVFSTGTILLVTFVGILFFKETLNRRQITGLCMILISLILLNL